MESEKLKKGGWKYGEGQVFLKGGVGEWGSGGWVLTLFLFNFFKFYYFYI